jgi:exonuclease III
MNIISIKDIILVNWNANGLKSKRSTLAEFLSRHKIGIASITETHLKDSETFKIPGYDIYRNDKKHTHSSGGVSILIKKKPKTQRNNTATHTSDGNSSNKSYNE